MEDLDEGEKVNQSSFSSIQERGDNRRLIELVVEEKESGSECCVINTSLSKAFSRTRGKKNFHPLLRKHITNNEKISEN